MDKHWLLDRQDPRPQLAVSIAVLLVGLVAAIAFLREGGWLAVFGGVWVATSLAQLVYSAVRVLKMRRSHGNAVRRSPRGVVRGRGR